MSPSTDVQLFDYFYGFGTLFVNKEYIMMDYKDNTC